MLVQIRKARRAITAALLLVSVFTLVSCQTQKEALVNDPDDKKTDSLIPWNKQEKWETQGNMANITDRR
jgi:hypothetical protein